MYFGTKFSSEYSNWSSWLCGGYVVLLVYYLCAKIGVCGIRIYCMLRFMVMTTGCSSIYYVLGVVRLLWGMWHDFSILSWLVWLKRVGNRRKYMLILQGESRNVQRCLNVHTADHLKWMKFGRLWQRLWYPILPGPISFPNLKCFPSFCVYNFGSKSNLSLPCWSQWSSEIL